jgi:hypothetical protein
MASPTYPTSLSDPPDIKLVFESPKSWAGQQTVMAAGAS